MYRHEAWSKPEYINLSNSIQIDNWREVQFLNTKSYGDPCGLFWGIEYTYLN